MADYTETFRLKLDLGDIGGAATAVEREVARIQGLIRTASQSIPGTSGIAAAGARAELVSAVPTVQRTAAELASAAQPDVFTATGSYNATAAKLQAEVAALQPALTALGLLPPALQDAGRVGARAEAAARAALADLASAGGGGIGRGQVPFGLSTAAEDAVKKQASYEAAEREDLVAVVRKRMEAERAVATIMTEVEGQARVEIAERTRAVPQNISSAAIGRTTELAELENADREQLVAAVRTRIGAEEQIRAIQTEIEAQARSELAAGSGVAASTVPAAISTAATSRVEQLAALEAADRGELVATVRQRLEAEQKIRLIEEQVEKQARAEMSATGGGGGGGGGGAGGTLTQRLQKYIGGGDKDAADYRGIGQILSSRLLTSSTFAVSGFATFQALQTIRSMVEEAQRAEQAMSRLKAQFDAVGQSDAFPRVAQEINAIARDTGTAVDVVAQMAGTMKGAFVDTDLAIQQTRQSIEGMQALQINAGEAQNVLLANALTFYGRTGDAIQKVSDVSLHLHDVFGVSAKEIAEGVANIAPLAKEMGLSFEQTATIIAGAAARSGRSATQVANEIGRALTQVQKQQIQVLALFQQGGPQAQAAVPNIAEAIRNQQPGEVLIEVTKHWHDLTGAQQEAFIQMVGGRREAASLAAALGASDDIVKELTGKMDSHGRTAKEVAAIHQSLAYQLGRFREELRQLADNIVRSGLGQFLGDIARAGGFLLGVLNTLLGAFAAFNDLTHGVAGRILEVIAAIKILSAISRIGIIESLLFGSGSGVIGGLGGITGALLSLVSTLKSQGILSALQMGGKGLIGSPLGQAGIALGVGYGAQALVGGDRVPPVFSTLGNIGAGAAVGGPVGAAVGAAYSVGSYYAKTRDEVKNEADKFKKDLAQKNIAELQQVEDQVHSDVFSRAGDWIFGQTTPEHLIHQAEGTQYKAAEDRHLQSLKSSVGTQVLRRVSGNAKAVFDDKTVKGLQDALAQGGDAGRQAMEFINKLVAAVGEDGPKSLEAYRAALANYDANKAQKAAGDLVKIDPKTGISDSAKTAQSIMSDLQAGIITQQEAIDQLKQVKSAYDVVGQITDPAQAKELAGIVKDIQTITGQMARDAIDIRIQLEQATGAKDPVQIAQESASAYGQLAGRSDVDENTRKAAAQEAIKAIGEQFSALLAAAQTADDIARLLGGIPVPPEVLAMAAQHGVAIPAVTQLTREQKDQVFQKFQSITAAQEAYAKSIDQTDPVKSALDSQAKATKDVAEALAIFGRSSPEYQAAQTELNNANEEVRKARRQIDDLSSQVTQSTLQRDPVASAREALRQAKSDLANAAPGQETMQAQIQVNTLTEELRQRQEEVTKAWETYVEDLDSGNPVTAAQDAVNAANRALAVAVPGTAAYIQAQQAVLDAQRRLSDAQRDMANAQLDYLIAVANSSDDILAADNLRLQQLQNNLRDAQQKGDIPGQTEASAQIVDQMKKVRDDQVSVTERNVDFQLQMGQISTQAAVARLRGLLDLVKGDEKQTQEILLRIHQLEAEAAQNATFDIPQDIRLPTLYEARRLNQSEAAGTGYNDNRVVQVQYNAYGAQDHQSNLSDLQSLLAGAPRSGVTPRSY